jgi:uncharacterized membrane protein YsdA (DUF1294 family)
MLDSKYLYIYLIGINLISFFSMGYDKYLAKNFKWRISEKTLLFLSLILGAFGSYAGMQYFRHKTKHAKFTIGVPLIFILNIISLYILNKYNIIKLGYNY